jgi:CHASE3 domain sensor protein
MPQLWLTSDKEGFGTEFPMVAPASELRVTTVAAASSLVSSKLGRTLMRSIPVEAKAIRGPNRPRMHQCEIYRSDGDLNKARFCSDIIGQAKTIHSSPSGNLILG